MNGNDIEQALGVVETLCDTLTRSMGRLSLAGGSEWTRLVANMRVGADGYMRERRMGDALRDLMAATTASGASLRVFEAVVVAMSALEPDATLALALVRRVKQFAAIEAAKVAQRADLRSREAVNDMQRRITTLFDPVIDEAADAREPMIYRALLSLHGLVTRDLAQRGRPLPRLVPYAMPGPLPALHLSNRFYGTSDRERDLREENRVVHPLFMPAEGRALSA